MPLDKRQPLKSTALAVSVALLLAVGAGSAFSAGPAPGGDQSGQPQGPGRPAHGGSQGMMDPQRMEERLTALKADLKITDVQTQAWNGFADAMRANATAMRDAAKDMRPAEGATPDALRRMEAMDAMAKAHARSTDRLLAAFRPLYAQMTDEQRQAAAQKLMLPPPPRG